MKTIRHLKRDGSPGHAFLPGSVAFRSALAFSLIEVTLAIGLVSFCFLTVVGLMPVGLNALRLATGQTVEAEIVQKLSGQILLTPFSKLPLEKLDGGYSGATFYYDQEGGELLGSNTSNGIYSVTTSSTNAVVYPGSGTNSLNSLRLVQINVKKTPGISGTNTFNVYVPSSGN